MRFPAVTARTRLVLILTLSVAALLGGTLAAVATTGGAAARANVQAAQSPTPTPYIFAHDPTMAKEGGTYYLFSTGDPAGVIGNGNIQIRTSTNLRDWTYAGTVFATKLA